MIHPTRSNSMRPTRIDALGEIPWGTHCCLLYDSPELLTAILADFFKAGLGANEYCLWMTSGRVSEQSAKQALSRAEQTMGKDADRGCIEILSVSDLYGASGAFDAEGVVQTWLRYAEKALVSGYEGFRLAGDPFVPCEMDSRIFINYETRFDRIISSYPIIALCVYPLDKCASSDIAHLSSHHEYTLVANHGELELVANPNRQELENALKTSRELFHSIVDPNPDAVFIVDSEEFIRFANKAGECLLGQSNEALKGSPFPFSFQCGQRSEVEVSGTNKTSLTGEVRATNTQWQGDTAYLVCIRDISERKTAELVLEKQQQELSAIYENTPTPMLLVDHNNKIQKANAATRTMAGRSQNELVGVCFGNALSCIRALDHPKGCGCSEACDQCPIRKTIQDTFYSGTSHKKVTADLTFQNNGHVRNEHFLISTISLEIGEPLILICLEDITELKQTMDSLHASETRLRSIFQAAPVGIGTVIPETEQDGRVTARVICDANERLCRMTGYSEEEIKGMESGELYESRAEYERIGRDLYTQVRETGRGKVESRWRRKDGGVIDIELSAAPFNPGDWSGGITFVLMDITQLKKAEAEQKRLEAQLRQSQKMEAIGQLTGGIAHDFNNLLQIINGFGDMIKDELDLNHPARPALDEILKAGERAAELVRQLLAFSRQQVMKMDHLSLNDLIRKLIEMIQRIIGEHIEFEFIPGRNLGMVRGDAGQIEQVIINLCINARDAMPEGGRLMIETSNVFINGEYCKTHLEAQPGRYVLICVTDNGGGMDEATQARIFDPFFTTKNFGLGSGLGLSTAYGIIRQHEGSINVYSEAGRGSLFKIYLPISERRATEVDREIPAKTRGGNETILIAEDDQMVRGLMQTILERAGYTTLTAENGEAAIETIKTRKDEIDMAILDVVMPKKSGKAVFDHIQQIKPSMAVLFASGYSENAIHTNFILETGLELIQKPFASGQLLHKTRELLDRTK